MSGSKSNGKSRKIDKIPPPPPEEEEWTPSPPPEEEEWTPSPPPEEEAPPPPPEEEEWTPSPPPEEDEETPPPPPEEDDVPPPPEEEEITPTPKIEFGQVKSQEMKGSTKTYQVAKEVFKVVPNRDETYGQSTIQYPVSPDQKCGFLAHLDKETCDDPFTDAVYAKGKFFRDFLIPMYMKQNGTRYGGSIMFDAKTNTAKFGTEKTTYSTFFGRERLYGFLVKIQGKDSDAGHANAVLIDKDKSTIEYFEPHGSIGKISKLAQPAVHKLLSEVLSQYAPGRKFKFLSADIICPYWGPQAVSGDRLCANWSLLFLMLRIACPSISARKIVDDLSKHTRTELVDLMKHFNCFYWNLARKHDLDKVGETFGHLLSNDELLEKNYSEILQAYSGNFQPILSLKLDVK